MCQEQGRNLSDFGLPHPTHYTMEVSHEMQQWSSQPDLLLQDVSLVQSQFNTEQHIIFQDIATAITEWTRPPTIHQWTDWLWKNICNEHCM
jgi:aspartyl/asparaginyl beta-hydroxylase (cupin superfamily)